MNKISAMILLVALVVLIPIIDAQSRGGGRGGEVARGRPIDRGVARPIQRTPAMSRAALYSGAAELGAAAGSNNSSQPEVIEVTPSGQSQ